MRSAKAFIDELATIVEKGQISSITVELYGSLAATGKGHYTDRASILGLCGYDPKTVPTSELETILEQIQTTGKIKTPVGEIKFDLEKNVKFMPQIIPDFHVNGMKIIAKTKVKKILKTI